MRQARSQQKTLESFALELRVWQTTLEAKRKEMYALEERQSRKSRPILVSRARKQPQLDFLDTQSQAAMTLGGSLTEIRRRLAVGLARIREAENALERRTTSSDALFEIPKRQILQDFQAPHELWATLHARALDHTRRYESARNTFKQLIEKIAAIPCIEDVYRRPLPWWRKLRNAGRGWWNKRSRSL
jgi:hypothetical protein